MNNEPRRRTKYSNNRTIPIDSMAAEEEPITTLNPNDVLLGRGHGFSQWQGNLRMRELVETQRAFYQTARNKSKGMIAKEIVTAIQSRGGRFLKLVESSEPQEFIVEEGIWVQVEDGAAEEKIKQCLRERHKSLEDARKRTLEDSCALGGGNGMNMHLLYSASNSLNMTFGGLSSLSSGMPVASMVSSCSYVPSLSALSSGCSPMLPMIPAGNNMITSVIDPRLLLFQPVPYTVVGSNAQFSVATGGLLSCGPSQGKYEPMNPLTTQSPMNGVVLRLVPDQHTEPDIQVEQKRGGVGTAPDDRGSSEEDVENLLSILSLSDRLEFTEQQAEIESATLTDAEKAEALSDVFGRNGSANGPENKKPRRDLDNDSIDFLVKQMRKEIEAIPNYRKQALMEAKAKARSEEFSDERLVKFLRCQGMNSKLAAQRFVNYWESRREVFGAEKFLLRMTLSEALRDDANALNTGVQLILPYKDVSGRSIIYYDPSKHTREGYTAQSMLRALWYGFEVCAQHNSDVDNSVVEVFWNRNSTVFDYDRQLHDRFMYFKDNLPLRIAAMHVCCSASFIIKVIKPVLWVMKSKESRSRTLYHNVPETEIMRVLTEYGILDSMLPNEMGGTLQFDQSEWLAQRRAVETEEIA